MVTRKQIKDQNLTSLTEIMDKTTGVTHSRASQTAGSSLGNDSNFYSRGLKVNNIQIDCGPLDTVMVGFGSVSQLDMAQFDHVEFLRGVDGLYSGPGDPGGRINLVRKRALDHIVQPSRADSPVRTAPRRGVRRRLPEIQCLDRATHQSVRRHPGECH
ncbi:TonB-dependent receptor plug domain-containing protein [Pseudomonas sp. WHRI 8519]|uniref:TonB-dependent receptor plug domain-containing protein n=1 Tax=Pseudomonas sp. WHRI 8519 TaxID=3162567 RepID=UPI0032EB55D4